MLVYNYDRASGEYVGAEEADPDPLVPGAFLIPANATLLEPPATAANEAAVFDPAADAWHTIDTSWRQVENVLAMIAGQLAAVGPLIDAFSDLDALGMLDDEDRTYLATLRIYRVRLRMVHKQPGFPGAFDMPAAPEIRPLPADPLRKPGPETGG